MLPAFHLRFRSYTREILDHPGVPESVRERCYRDLARMHRWLGNFAFIVKQIKHDPLPVNKVLDVGCAHGALLLEIQRQLRLEVVGVDLRPPQRGVLVPILRGDAIYDRLPAADVAVTLMMAHHLTAAELSQLIANVGRSCRRFLIVDLVRHSVPALLFRAFVAPFVNRINVEDGARSLSRAFTPFELNQIVRDALAGSGATFRHEVARFSIRQLIDINYLPRSGGQQIR
jgi:2-polyprenyl-3-methyl-5-hydroxy-6-metoxy-1,4-benzoquinol methylase